MFVRYHLGFPLQLKDLHSLGVIRWCISQYITLLIYWTRLYGLNWHQYFGNITGYSYQWQLIRLTEYFVVVVCCLSGLFGSPHPLSLFLSLTQTYQQWAIATTQAGQCSLSPNGRIEPYHIDVCVCNTSTCTHTQARECVHWDLLELNWIFPQQSATSATKTFSSNNEMILLEQAQFQHKFE